MAKHLLTGLLGYLTSPNKRNSLMKYPNDKPGIYAIHIAGRLDTSWSECLGGLTIAYEEGDGQDNQPISILYGWLPDQAALFGVLNALYNARYSLLFVRYLRSGELIQAHQMRNN